MSKQPPNKPFGNYAETPQLFNGTPAFGGCAQTFGRPPVFSDSAQTFGRPEVFIYQVPPVEPSFAVLIVDGEPVVMNTKLHDNDGKIIITEDHHKWMANPNNMKHVSGTCDTYRCKDCDIALSGYKRGDPKLDVHVYKDILNGGKCEYIRSKFRGREKELVVLKGTLRFQHGHMAFPEYMMYAKHMYITIADTKYCVVCASNGAQDHYPACEEMVTKLKSTLRNIKFDVPLETAFLFRQSSFAGGWSSNHFAYQINSGLETDGYKVKPTSDFTILGEPAGMEHVKGYGDTHTCRRCNLHVKDFVQGDTLLGEHVYHV